MPGWTHGLLPVSQSITGEAARPLPFPEVKSRSGPCALVLLKLHLSSALTPTSTSRTPRALPRASPHPEGPSHPMIEGTYLTLGLFLKGPEHCVNLTTSGLFLRTRVTPA